MTSASESTSPSFFGSSLISIGSPYPLLSAPAHSRTSLGFHFPRALGFALVVQFLSLCDGQFHFDVPAFQVHLGDNQREPFFTRFSQQFVDLFSMEQQLAPPGRLMVLPVAMRILADVGVQQPSLVVLYLGKAILQLDAAILGGLHFGAGKRNPG